MEQQPKITTQNKIGLIISLVTIFAFIIIAFLSSLYDSNVCDPERHNTIEKLSYISEYYNSIVCVKLAKSAPGYIVNLVNDTVIINDPLIIEKIRTMIKSRKLGEWNHPSDQWEVSMTLNLNNNESLCIRVCKINNDSLEQMTHLYFASKNCTEEQPQYSLELGHYLEEITGYRRMDYK